MEEAFASLPKLQYLYLGRNVISIRKGAFSPQIFVNVSVDANFWVHNGTVLSRDESVLVLYTGTSEYVSIPSSIKRIGPTAFAGSISVETVVIGDNVTDIGDSAFESSYIKSATIGANVQSIGSAAFRDCGRLVSIDVPKSVQSIEPYTFYNCSSLMTVRIGNNCSSIGKYAFFGCKYLKQIVIPNSVTFIGEGAFESCISAPSMSLPDSLTSIEARTFYSWTSLKNISLGNGIEAIGDYAFYECKNLVYFEIPNSVISIGKHAFESCSSITSVAIGEGVTSIGDHAFAKCAPFSLLSVPSSVEFFGRGCFGNSVNQESVIEVFGSYTNIPCIRFSILPDPYFVPSSLTLRVDLSNATKLQISEFADGQRFVRAHGPSDLSQWISKCRVHVLGGDNYNWEVCTGDSSNSLVLKGFARAEESETIVLSPGLIVCIVVSVIALLGVVFGVYVLFIKKKSQNKICMESVSDMSSSLLECSLLE